MIKMLEIIKKWWGIVPLIAFLIFWQLYQWKKADWEDSHRAAMNLSASTMKMDSVNEHLVYRLATAEKDLKNVIQDTTALWAIVKRQKEQINLYAKISTQSRVDTFVVKLDHSLDTNRSIPIVESRFDTTQDWFSMKGTVDSAAIHFQKLIFKDELEFVLTQNEQGWVKGYVQNKSPFARVNNLIVSVKAQEKIWNWTSFGTGVISTLLGVFILVLLIK